MRLPKFRLQSLSAIARGLRSHQEMRRAGDKNTKRRSSRPPAWLLVVLALLVALFVVSAKSASPPQQSSLGERAQSGAAISTDREVYLGGETVNVFGSGFSPYERVGLRVTHANGNRESNMGHEMWWTNADFDGTFKAAWTVNSGDSGGAGFIIEAEGSSGSSAQAMFVRGAVMSTDGSSYQSGEKAWITAHGFNPGERVNIAVQDGRNRAPLIRLADENGQVRTEVELPAEKPAAGFVTIKATATESGVMSSLTIPYTFFAVLDQQGANDKGVQDQSDLTQMGRDNSDLNYYQIFWSWDSIDQWTGNGQTGDACALFDSDADGKINYAVCGQITNLNANPNVVVQTTGSPFAFQCNNARTDRCGNPAPKSFTSTDIQASTLPGSTATPAGNVITDTDPFGPTAPNGPGSNYPNDATLYMKIRKGFLPANSILVNVCSYPSAGNGGNNNPFDCIVSPGGGFLRIKKVANGNTTSTTSFNFLVNPVPSGQPSNYGITGSGQTLPIGVAIGSGAETVSETVPQNWTLTLAGCTLESGAGIGSFDNANHRVTGITIESGKTTTCTFTNYENTPNISVVKDNDGNRDTFFTDNETLPANAVYPYTVTYKVSITNSGGSGTISSIIDDKTGSLTLTGSTTAPAGAPSCASLIGTTIGTGVSKTCNYDVTFGNANASQVINQVTVTVTSPAGNSQASDRATVNFPQSASLTLAKSASPTSYNAMGQVITYTYTITNSGNITLAGPFSVSDDKLGTISPCGAGPLALGASTSCTSIHTITQADIDAGSITNKATASGNGLTSNQASFTVTASQNKILALAKSATPTTYSAVGQTITYTYTVTNNGNTTLAGPFSVADDKQGTISPCGSGPLAPGASTSCTSTHTITQADIDAGSITNKATASGNGLTSNQVSATVTANQTKAITLVESASPTTYSAVGQVITYTYKLTHSRSTTLAGPFSVADNKLGTINPCGSGPLAPGASTSCTSPHTLTQ